MTFGEKLSKIRRENNYTQEQLAQILGVSRQSVSKWESDTAYPETDKLIHLAKLFKCSMDYLLIDDSDNYIKDNEKSQCNQTKTIGYILFAVSFLSIVLILVLSRSIEDLFISLPLAITILVCSFICMFVKYRVWYWCLWTALIPLVSLSPGIVGFPIFSSTTVVLVAFVVAMMLVARKVFSGVKVATSKKKSFLIIISWLSIIGLRVWSFNFTLSTSDVFKSLPPYMFVSLLLYIAIALLTTYTVCYTKSKSAKFNPTKRTVEDACPYKKSM